MFSDEKNFVTYKDRDNKVKVYRLNDQRETLYSKIINGVGASKVKLKMHGKVN